MTSKTSMKGIPDSIYINPLLCNVEINNEKQTMITKISALTPIINAITVLASFEFIIWTTCFRKTRQDRLDELKFEMRVLFSEGWDDRKIRSPKTLEDFF